MRLGPPVDRIGAIALAEGTAMRKLSILMADIDFPFAERVGAILLSGGMEATVRSAADLDAFQSALSEESFDAILSDYHLPGGNGLLALALARRACPRTPFLFLTDPCGEEVAVESLRKGAADFLLKSGLARLPGRLRRVLKSYGEAAGLREAHELLRQERARFSGLIENTSDAVWSMDLDGNVLAFNSAASLLSLKLAGRPMEPGGSFLRGIPAGENARWTAALARIRSLDRFDEGFSVSWQGREFLFQASCSAILDEGRLAGMAVFARDISERERERDSLEESEARFRTLSEASIEAIAVMKDGRIEAANRAMAGMFGYTVNELGGREIADFIAPEFREEVRSRSASGQEARYEAAGIRSDGSRFPIEIRGMSSPAAGVRIKGILDLSRQKRTEEELDSFFRLSLDMFCILGFDGVFRRVNPAWERILGYAPETLAGSHSMELIHPEDREATLAQARLLGEGREMASFENRYRHADGTWRWLLWSASARPTEGLIYAVARDVTDRKRAEEENRQARAFAEEASRAKGRFLASVSHEIRTPMNGVVSMAGLLAETPLDARQQGYVKIIQTSARSLLRVINDILDFSKLEQGKLKLENRVFDLRELVGDVAELFFSTAGDKGVRLDWSFAPDTPRQVRADPGRLRQVLVNLVGNAVKFTDAGKVEIRAWVAAQAEGESELRFEVRDSGPGIDAGAGGRLFQPFSQADASDTRKHGGTGLGLAISKQLTELMGGEIGFESEPGKGSLFWFTVKAGLPRSGARSEEAPGAFPEPVAEVPDGNARPMRILVAEDNPINQMVAVCLLERLGYHADIVANGLEALEACKAVDYDIIFMDCQMPELDGYGATAHIRRLEKQGRHRSYIVAMTADAWPGSRERCMAAGMDAHLTKPVLIADLKMALALGRAVAAASPLPAALPASAPSAASETDPIDFRIVERLRASIGADDGMFGELVEGFLADAKAKVRGLQGFLAEGKGQELAMMAHGLKGLSLNFGCLAMARKCEAIQRAVGADTAGEAGPVLAALASELARAEGRLRELLATAAARPAGGEGKDG